MVMKLLQMIMICIYRNIHSSDNNVNINNDDNVYNNDTIHYIVFSRKAGVQ